MGLGERRELVMGREAGRAAVHGVAKSCTRLSDWTELNQFMTSPSSLSHCSSRKSGKAVNIQKHRARASLQEGGRGPVRGHLGTWRVCVVFSQDFENGLSVRYACNAMNFPLSTAFIVSHRFWVVVFSFSFVSMHILISFLISSVIYWLFKSMLFSLHMFVFLIVFFFSCSWHQILLHCDQIRCLKWFQYF